MAQDNSVRLMYIPSNDKGKGAEKKNGKDKLNTKSKRCKKSSEPKETKCMIGSVVSDFEASVYLSDDEHFDGKLNPKELAGVHTILFFFSGNFFGPVNEDLTVFLEAARSGEFLKLGLDLNFLAISTDSVEAHRMFCHVGKENGGLMGLKVALLSDQTGEISKMFNVYDQSTHKAFPSYVILSPELKVVAKFTSDHNVAIDPMAMVGILEQLLVSPKDAKSKNIKKDLKADHEDEEDPMSDSGFENDDGFEENNGDFENESDSEVQKRILRREKIKEGDKAKAERAKKEAN